MAQNQVSELAIEVLNSGAANQRVSELGVEVLYAGAARLLVSEVSVEVLRSVADAAVTSAKPPLLIIVT